VPSDPGVPPVPSSTPQAPAAVAGTALEVATWVLAALGLGPLSRVVVAAKPLVVKLAELIFGKPKVEAAKPAP
jgi:hypothetical protein